jgi:hypothetical protein
VRLARLATPIAVLTLALAGCGGGSKVFVQEVPAGSQNLKVTGGEALAPKATATPTPTASATATAGTGTAGSATATPSAQTNATATATATPTTPQSTTGGGATAPASTPPPGSGATQFETFCQQNPGAC